MAKSKRSPNNRLALRRLESGLGSIRLGRLKTPTPHFTTFRRHTMLSHCFKVSPKRRQPITLGEMPADISVLLLLTLL